MNSSVSWAPDSAGAVGRLPLRCAVLTSTTFVLAYSLSNHLTSLRSDIGAGVFAWERGIPFLAWTIVPYLSICVFFVLSFFVDADPVRLRRHVRRLLIVLGVSVACYAAFPLRFTFERPPTDGGLGLLFDLLGHCDMPYNRAPSLHISVLVLLWARFASCVRRPWALALHIWFALIAVSVLTTYQHHVLDVPAGAALGAVAMLITAPARRRLRQGNGSTAGSSPAAGGAPMGPRPSLQQVLDPNGHPSQARPCRVIDRVGHGC